MTLSIYIDFKNPASYLALNPTCALLRRLDIEARWLPFHTNEETVPERKAEETRGDSHRRVRALARRRTHLLYAQVQGLEMQFRTDPGSTEACLAALAFLTEGLSEDPARFIRAAFTAYWLQGADLDDPATVAALWAEHVPGHKLELQQGRAALARIREDAIAHKVFHAPTYLLGDQLFLGREHLPWIEKLLRQPVQD